MIQKPDPRRLKRRRERLQPDCRSPGDPVGVHIIEDLIHDVYDLPVDGIHFGMEFQTEYAVSNIDKTCRIIAHDDLVVAPGSIERHFVPTARNLL